MGSQSAWAHTLGGLTGIVGAAVLGFGVYNIDEPAGASLLAVGGGSMALSFGLLALGRWLRGSGKPSVTAAQLKARVEERAIPFSVCTDCRVVIELPYGFACPQCGEAEFTIAVREESERSIALAAIGVDA